MNDTPPVYRGRGIIYPTDNSIYNEVVAVSIEDFDYLKEKIFEQEFSADAEGFLVLLLMRILADEDPVFISSDQVNKEADKFIIDYPDSPMVEIVKKHISFKYRIGDWTFGVYFGGGYTIPSGNMLDYISSSGALNFSFDVYYKRSAFMVSVQSGFGRVQQDIPVKDYGYWERGMSSSLTSVGLGLGFSAFDNVKFRITPFTGLSFGSAYPSGTDLDRKLQNFSIGTSIAPMFGLNITYRFVNLDKLSRSNSQYFPAYGSYGINARITYVPGILRQEGHQYNGNIWYLTIGLNMELFGLKRIY